MRECTRVHKVTKGGIRIASRKDVAELAGVSEATVSRVLNGVGPMKEETRQRVREAAEKLGYVPSALARNFATSRSGNIGVVLPYVPKVHMFSSYFFSEILSGIGSKVRELGYDILLLFQTPDERMDYIRWFHTHKIDTCIVLGSKDEPEELSALRKLSQENLPFCLINQHFEDESFSEVDADHTSGSYLAVKHLVEQGYERIAFINGPLSYSNSRDRLKGYVQALSEANLPIDESLIFKGNFSRSSGYAAAVDLMKQIDKVDAVFGSNDRMAIGLMQGLRDHGLPAERLPALIGFDNSDASQVTTPALSSVKVPFYEMGEIAAAELLRRLEHGVDVMEPFRIMLPTELVIRASTLCKSHPNQDIH